MLLLKYLVQAFNELADEFALLYAQSLSDDGDEVNNHIEREANTVKEENDDNVGDNAEDTDDAQEEIVELDTVGDFEKMRRGRGFITLQVTHNLTCRCCVYFQLNLLYTIIMSSYSVLLLIASSLILTPFVMCCSTY